MKILQIARYGSVRGGAETYIATIATGLRDAGHEVVLAYGTEPDSSRREVADGVHIPALVEPGVASSGDGEATLAAFVERFAPDVIHCHLPDVPWVVRASSAVAPTVLAVHDHKLNCPVGTRYWTASKASCTVTPGAKCLGYNVVAHCGSLRANATLRPYRSWKKSRKAARGMTLQVFSESVKRLMTTAGFAPDAMRVTPYPVPPSAVRATIENPDPRGRPVVFATGRLNKEKGFAALIDAMNVCDRPAHLVIAGEGHERASLERRASSTSGPHRITFTGWLTAGEQTAWYEEASLVAVPSMWPEPFGIVGLEAMAAARPVIAFDSGGIAEWLVDGVTGVLVPTGDIRSLGKGMAELLRDPERLVAMGQAGQARVAVDFSLVAHVEALLALYQEARA